MKKINPILQRLYSQLDIKKDIEFSNRYNISKSSIAGWRHRDVIPYKIIKNIVDKEGLNLVWILDGGEEPLRDPEYILDEREKKIIDEYRKMSDFDKELFYYRTMINISKILHSKD